MTRANLGILHPLDPEIDRTFHRLNRANRNPSLDSDLFDSISLSNFDFSEHSYTVSMAEQPPRERTLRELAAPDFTYESLCIQELPPIIPKKGCFLFLFYF